ncbi:alpha/beta hydrolase [Rodentibacter myodis]|uniref:Alpha/beta hydrolase n=2 Tax=Rodentibacter myodis TaxID=1907939 RepID=A0A1V3JUZ0_9PAST|nr:alpha/beta hydrolase [Rodentibacter myodis]
MFEADNQKSVLENKHAVHWIVPSEGSQPAVNLYVYKPQQVKGKLPVIYFIHGGGYVMGNAKSGGDSLQTIADRQKAAVVSLEYRLASEAPFPADLNDAYHGLRYIYQNAEKLGLDNQRVVLMGESAGGGLTARLALYTRDQREFAPEGQVLIYPMLDYRTGTDTSPYRNPYSGEFAWTAAANRLGWTALRGGQSISDGQMPYFSPAMAKKLDNLPPTFIMVGDLDLFVNEDIDYANKLIQAGVPTELFVIPGVFHVFEMANPEGQKTKNYLNWRSNAIDQMFKNLRPEPKTMK